MLSLSLFLWMPVKGGGGKAGPSNAMTLGGEVLTFGGAPVTFGGSS